MQQIQPKIYITNFDVESALEYVEQLNLINQTFGPEQPIVVHIESYGGTVEGFFIIHEALINSENPIIPYTTGMCASAGLFLFCSVASGFETEDGTIVRKRIVGKNAMLMFHGIQTQPPGGDLEDVEEFVRSTRVVNDRLMDLAAQAVGVPSGKELKELVRNRTKSHDMNMTAEEAVSLGFADEIGSIKMQPVFMYNIGIIPNQMETTQEVLDLANDEKVQEVYEKVTGKSATEKKVEKLEKELKKEWEKAKKRDGKKNTKKKGKK